MFNGFLQNGGEGGLVSLLYEKQEELADLSHLRGNMLLLH